MDKRQEIVKRRARDLRLDFGNPRKVKKQRREDLEKSLETYGDFDIIVINEQNQVLGGNQRVKYFQRVDPDAMLDCKMLIGYTLPEQKYVNIKLNTHAGEWVMEDLADWTADLMNFKIDDVVEKEKPLEERMIKDMEPIHYEQYDYVLIACRNELDYNDLIRKLGIEGCTIPISKRRIKARAIWYDQMKGQLIGADEIAAKEAEANG